MAEKPILFSTPMVRAILDGRKTQTRRVIKINGCPITSPKESLELTKEGLIYHSICSMSGYYKLLCQPGDILWVRETWLKADDGYYYKADIKVPSESENLRKTYGYKWRPSIFMPREAARIFLRVTNVRVERLQDISEEDARAEGFEKICFGLATPGAIQATSKELFTEHWDALNAKRGYSWHTNPWVWVIEFERINKE